MQPSIRLSLGMLIVAPILTAMLGATARSGATRTPVVQGGALTACSIIDAEQLKRLTGRMDLQKQGPKREDPAIPDEGLTECSFLGFNFELNAPAKREWFDETRSDLTTMGMKIQAVSGVGDGAYYWWDPGPGDMRLVGIALRVGTSGLMITDMTSPDLIALLKPELLKVARAIVPKLR